MRRRGYTIFKASESILHMLLGKPTEEEEKEYVRMKEETGLDKADWLNDRHFFRRQLESSSPFDTEKAYGEFRAHIRSVKRRTWKYRLRLAAVFLLPFCVGGGVALLYFRQPVPVISVGIEPVKPMASIQLEDGTRIHLQETIDTLAQTDGTMITNRAGQLSYHRTENDRPGAVVYHELTVPRGGEYMLILADGTRVWLNADSKLKFPVHFSGSTREVFLSGEAYFAVEPDAVRPFIVHTSLEEVRVMGTEFNVRDYEEEKSVVTTLVKGTVAYRDILLKPGFQVRASAVGGPLKVEAVNLKEYTGWKDGLYVFDHLTLGEMMRTVERNYDVTVFFTSEDIKKLRFSGDLRKYERVETFLNFIELGGDVTFTVKGKTIVVSRK